MFPIKIKLQFILIASFLFFGFLVSCQTSKVEVFIHKNIQEQTEVIFDSLVKLRRDFHQYPEVSEHEKRTSDKIAKYLKKLGLEVKTNIGGYGVVGILKGNKPGKKIAWRSDIDAMPSDIPDVVDFKSKNKGVRHICGHDVNTTIGLGIANVLTSQKENLTGTVYFIFQPSEENFKGANAMIKDGLFDIINPAEIYATHIAPMPSTMISTKPEWMFAEYRVLKVSYKSSNKDEAIIDHAKKVISSFQNVEPESKFWDNRNLLDPNIGIANPNTIYKNYVTVNQNFSVKKTDEKISISTFISSSIMKKLDTILPLLKEKLSTSKFSKDLIKVEYLETGRANIVNDKNLTKKSMKSISEIYGKENTFLLYGEMPDGRGDDFAFFQKHVPGVYFYLGGSNFEKGIISMPHAPNFAVDEECIKTGVNYFSSMIVERLKE